MRKISGMARKDIIDEDVDNRVDHAYHDKLDSLEI